MWIVCLQTWLEERDSEVSWSTVIGVEGREKDEWELDTPDRIHRYRMRIEVDSVPAALICTVGVDSFSYRLQSVSDLYQMLITRGDWVELGAKDEKGTPAEGTVEAWARSTENPVGGWYGLKLGWRGRFATYIPPILEFFGLAELEHNLTGNRMRAVPLLRTLRVTPP